MLKKGLSILTTISILLLAVSSVCSSTVSADEPVEILSLRSEYGKHFNNGDGTITAYINTAPIHYWQNNQWIDIDNTLVSDEYGNYTNKSNYLNVTIPSQLSVNNDEVKTENAVKLEYEEFSLSVLLTDLSINESKKDVYADIENNVQQNNNAAKVNIINYTQTDCSDNNIPLDVIDSYSNIVSAAVFESVYDDIDLSIDIQPESVIESVTFNSFEDIPDSLTYSIDADGLDLECTDSNVIDFINDNGECVFEIPAISVHDSSDESKSYAVDYEVSENNDGYLLTIYPGSNLTESENTVYPLTLSSEYTVERSVNTYCNSESSPNEIIRDQYMRISNTSGHGYQTYVSCNDLFVNYGSNATILDAKFNIFLRGNYIDSSKHIKIYSLQTQPMNCSWNNASTLDEYNTLVGGFDVIYTEMNSWKEIDVTALTQAWLNYGNSSQNIGIPCYGFKMVADSTPYATIVANSERVGSNKPYFEITYSLSSDYTLDYAPYKYNNITSNLGNIYNLQNRMNCYAYALQIYDRGSNNNSVHRLSPGEIGLLQNGLNYTFTQLSYDYNHAQTITDFMDFTEQQMFNDSAEMGTNLTKITLANNNQFVLPIGFNENSQRIIAMNAAIRYYDAPYPMPAVSPPYDYHFYLRHGNGTCPIHNDGICSMWSHKVAENEVSNMVNNTILCDNNIATQAKLLTTNGNYGVVNSYSQTLRFYTIEQDTNVFDSWYIYNNAQTPTSYHN